MSQNTYFSAILFISFIILITTFFSSLLFDIPISQLTRDPAFTTNTHPLIGGLSNIGVLFWAATSTICLFSSLLLYDSRSSVAHRFFFYFGILTFLLLIDDLFMIHDDLVNRYLNLDEVVVYAFYFLLTLFGIFYFKSFIITKTPYVFLIISFALFGCSILADMTGSHWTSGTVQVAFEDGVKFLGTAGWMGYFGIACYQHLARRLVDKGIASTR